MTILYKIICVYIYIYMYIDIILYIWIWYDLVLSRCFVYFNLPNMRHAWETIPYRHTKPLFTLLSLESSDPNLKETTWRTISASESYRSSSYVISIANALLENSNQTWGAACTACTNPKGAPAIWLTNTHYSSVSCSTTSQLTGMGGSTTTRIDSDY